MKRIIVHHDDLGFDHTMNDAFFALPFRTGSIIAAAPAADRFCGRATVDCDLGVHLTLTSDIADRPLNPLSDVLREMRTGKPLFATMRLAWDTVPAAVAIDEFTRQLGWIRQHGVSPTHLDAHMACIYRPDILSEVARMMRADGLSDGLATAFSWPGLPNPLGRISERYPDLEKFIDALALRRLRLVDTYLLASETKTEALARLLDDLPDGDYQLIHHSCTPHTKSPFTDYEVRLSDFRALSSQLVQNVLNGFVQMTHRSLQRQVTDELASQVSNLD